MIYARYVIIYIPIVDLNYDSIQWGYIRQKNISFMYHLTVFIYMRDNFRYQNIMYEYLFLLYIGVMEVYN